MRLKLRLTRLDQVMLGVDRLDMIKGIPQKLLAFEKFLVRYHTANHLAILHAG
jgi:trehalose-6-phosphate synthase